MPLKHGSEAYRTIRVPLIGLLSHLQARFRQPSAKKRVSKSVDKEIPIPVYTRIGNNRIASNHSTNRPAVLASRNTIRRA